MQLAIIILAHIWFLEDCIEAIKRQTNNFVFSSALITLVAWQQNTAWGIVTLCYSALATISHILSGRK